MFKIKYYGILFMVLPALLIAGAAERFIVLTTADTKEALDAQNGKYQNILNGSASLQRIQKNEAFATQMIESDGITILKVGPFKDVDALTLTYLAVRDTFPQAFILENPSLEKTPSPQIGIVEKEIVVEKEDQTLWIALFGLGIIGVLALFLSSDQIKNLKIKYGQMQDRQLMIEQKQSFLLEKMGEKIQTVALKNVNDKKKFLEERLEDIDTKEIRSRIGEIKKYDEALLSTTYEMIDFLKIKSGNIVIKQEAFQLSTMLHKLTNAVSSSLKSKHNTLYYDIGTDVSRYLMGDSERIYQVLHNILFDVLEYEGDSEVVLSIRVKNEEYIVFSIINKKQILNSEEIDTLFIPGSWEEIQDSNKEFGFFVINELISNMKGNFLLESDKKSGTLYELSLPYVKDMDSKSSKKELRKKLQNKKALVIDTDITKAKRVGSMLESFGVSVIFKSSDNLAKYRPQMQGLDFIIIKAADVSSKVFHFFKNMEENLAVKIVVIYDIFEKENNIDMASHIADSELYSPLIIGDVEEVLGDLCLRKTKKTEKKKEIFKEELQHFKITEKASVTRSDFQVFSHKNVLIVENNLVSQQVMSSILSASNLNVYKAENGLEAMIFLGEHPDIDLILMDVDMPLMDGYEATKMIRKNNLLKDIPVVAVTGLGFYNEVEQMLLSGMNACILKPFKIGQLYLVLERFLKQSKNENALEELTKVNSPKILDTKKGISYVRSDSFYKDMVAQVLIALKNSDVFVKERVQKGEIAELRAFCIDAVGLGGTIGSIGFVVLLNKMLTEISHKQEASKHEFIPLGNEEFVKAHEEKAAFMGEYVSLYAQEWSMLELEMKSYLNQ